MEIFERQLRGEVEKIMSQRPLVYINGPRQTGKSTFAQAFFSDKETNYITFDSPLILSGARTDPANFIKSLSNDKLNIIDEIQMAPEIFPYLKMAIDERRFKDETSCLYLLTGSANLLALPSLAQALVGRMSVITLLPFSSSEYKRAGINFINKLFDDELSYHKYGGYDLIDIIVNATFPEIAVHHNIDKIKWMDDYLTTLLERDVKNVADIKNTDKIIMLLSVLSMRAGGLINNVAVASEIGLDNKTYERYKSAIINTFIIFELPAWAKPARLNKRFTKSAKLFFNDTNLLAYVMRRDISEIYKNKETIMGHLFENFIASEIMKNACSLTNVSVSHFRTIDNKEVDFVIERAQGETIGIEVKLDCVVNENDFKGLKVLKNAVGEEFKKGIVIYTGNEIVAMGERFWAVPVCFLQGGVFEK